MMINKNDILFWLGIRTAIWFVWAGMVWTYWAALIIAYPFGVISLFIGQGSNQKTRQEQNTFLLFLVSG
jgi:hypothetical protein